MAKCASKAADAKLPRTKHVRLEGKKLLLIPPEAKRVGVF